MILDGLMQWTIRSKSRSLEEKEVSGLGWALEGFGFEDQVTGEITQVIQWD